MPAVKRCIVKEGTMPRVLEVLDLIVMSISDHRKRNKKKFQDVYTLCASKQASLCSASSFGRQCIDLTAISISSHRFETAAKLLWIVSQDKCTFETFLYRASMIIIENLSLSDENETVWNVVSKALKSPEVKKKEVKLEYLIYGLRHNILNTRDSLEKLFQKKGKSGSEKESTLKYIFDAYLALLDYIEWYKLYYGEMQSSQRKILPEKAIATFMQVVRNPGQWDIFVLKLIEMLEFSDRSDEIEDMLINYIECNPEHINAYIYLCVYLHDHDSESPNFIKYLKVLAELCPSDIRVLFLVEKWIISGENVKECLKHLFMFLDYPSNGQNIQAWKLLSRLLHQIMSSDSDKQKLFEPYWKNRYKSWNVIHFNLAQICQNEEDLELVACKVIVLSKLDPDSRFIEEVLQQLPRVEEFLSMQNSQNQQFTASLNLN